MTPERIETLLREAIDAFAAIEHERWAHWQRYVHSSAQRLPDGGLLLPAALVAQWERQIETPYAQLQEQEKQSDREQAERYLPLIAETVAKAVTG